MARIHTEFWKHQRGASSVSAAFSTLAHALIIGAWVVVTLPRFRPPPPDPDTPVWYLPPPDPKPAVRGSAETVRYVDIAPEGPGAGTGIAEEGTGVELDAGRPDNNERGNSGLDSTTTVEQLGSEGSDTVFTIIEVDTAARRLAESAAPRYPQELLEKRVEGEAIVQFVVDTTGLADTTSFVVVLASHPDFARSVRQALPGMRFSTARIGSMKVRQLVELPFAFNIAEPPPDTTRATAARRRPPG